MIALLVKTEIGILTKQTRTGGPVLPQTALMTTHLEGATIALETSIEIVTIRTGIGMDTGMGIGTAHVEIWIAMGAGIAMTTEAAETMTEAMTPG